jgi:hypothetical protein
LRSGAINDGRNNGVAGNTKAGEVGHVNHGANAGDCDVCFRFVSFGYVHVVFRTSGEVVGMLSVNHGCILLGEEEGKIGGAGFVVELGDPFCC